jgi:hypothetical protein
MLAAYTPSWVAEQIGPYMLSARQDAQDQANQALYQIGSSHDAESLRTWLARYVRAESTAEGIWLSGGRLKKFLQAMPGEVVTPGDWPIDYIDAFTRRYNLDYLNSPRHVFCLLCHYLAGGMVAPDVHTDLALARITSRQRFAIMGEYWGGIQGATYPTRCG